MENETLKKILKEKSVSFTAEELQLMIDEELEKSEEEMDTDLIDKCLDALDEIDEANAVVKKKRIKLRKALLIAAIVAIVLSIAIPVCAKILNINVSEEVVKRYNDYFDVNLPDAVSDENEVLDIETSLKDAGLNEIVLPRDVLNDEFKKYDFDVDYEDQFLKTIDFRINNSDIDGHVSIRIYDGEFDFSMGKSKANKDFEQVFQVDFDDFEAIIFNEDSVSCIYYIYGQCEYTIKVDCNIDQAKSIAETITSSSGEIK